MRTHTRFSLGGWLLACLLLSMVLAGCASSTAQAVAPTQAHSPATRAPGAPHCQPPSLITTSAMGMPEVQGTTSGKTELWALLFGPMVAKQELKIVWRMTGTDNMQVIALGPRGESLKPTWLTFHESSNWVHPGEEWGTGFILPQIGCWDFHVSRGGFVGDVWFLVK